MGVKDLLDTRQIGGGELTECRLNEMVVNAVAPRFDALNVTLNQALVRGHHPAAPRAMESMDSVDSRRPADELRLNGGVFSRLPHDYEFP